AENDPGKRRVLPHNLSQIRTKKMEAITIFPSMMDHKETTLPTDENVRVCALSTREFKEKITAFFRKCCISACKFSIEKRVRKRMIFVKFLLVPKCQSHEKVNHLNGCCPLHLTCIALPKDDR
ncbi:MAG TPA: hypothetical protein VFT90_03480, partial [Chryseosolibacter sp.]|nr:hypothetical protein [Chryseosolibacter sp.]